MSFAAKHDGHIIGYYETLSQAEIAIEIANDPYGPAAMMLAIFGDEYFMLIADCPPTYRLVD